jgi:tetratricopeptide (TPR) repeat protein
MKNMMWVAAALVLCGCQRNFDELLVEARQAAAEKNYTVVIDDTQLALPRWREQDGADKKSEAYELLGKSFHALQKLDQAADAYEQAVKLSDNAYDSAYALGVIHLASFQYEQAKDAFQAALRMKKNDPLALLGLGDCLYNLKRYEEARNAYRSVIEVSPGVSDALANLNLIEKRKTPVHLQTTIPKSSPLQIQRRKR